MLDYATSKIFMPIGGLVIVVFVGFVMRKEAVHALLAPYMGELGFKIWYFVLLRCVSPVAIILIALRELGILRI